MTNKRDHRVITIDQLPAPLSRIETYYDFLVGRTTELNQLPTPQSRIEMFLYYLCYVKSEENGGDGSFNSLTQELDAIIFKHNELEKDRISIISEQDILSMIQQLN